MDHVLYEKMTQLQWLLHKRQMRGWAHGGPMADPTRGQGRILAFLRLRDGISTKDLSYLLGIGISSLNEMLGKLEKAGYIAREPSEQDKRIMLVKLTEKGEAEEQSDTPDMGDVFACLTEEEQKNLGDYLDRIIEAMETFLSEQGDATFDRKREAFERFGYDFHRRMGKDAYHPCFRQGKAYGPHGLGKRGAHRRLGGEFHGQMAKHFWGRDKGDDSDGPSDD